VAYGYHVFKRERYLAAKAGHLRIALDSVYRKPGDLYDGYWHYEPSLFTGYLSQELPFFLYALAQHGKRVKPMYYTKQILELSTGKFRVIALDEEDRAFRFHWSGRAEEKPVRFTLTAPDGAIIRRGSLEPSPERKFTETAIEAPADGKKGEYVLTLEVGRSFGLVYLPMTDLPKEVFDTGHRHVTLVREPRVCFFVPDGCLNAKVTVGQYSQPSIVCFYDGKDELAARAQWLGTESFYTIVDLEPRPDQRGQIWAAHFGQKIKRSRLTLAKPLLPYISLSRDQFFLPRGSR